MKTKIKDHLANETRQEKEKKPDLGSFGRCKVCNDKASGIHYGLASCESCKVIFFLIYLKNMCSVDYSGLKIFYRNIIFILAFLP